MRGRPVPALLFLTALLGLLPLGFAAPAWACSCAGSSIAEQYERAGAVFTGRLLRRDSSGDAVTYVFAVDRVFKGEVHEQQGVVSSASGASCGLELQGGGPYVVFGRQSAGPPLPSPGNGQYAADLCGGTAPTSVERAAEVAALAGTAESAPRPGAAGLTGAGGTRWLLSAGALVAAFAALLAVRRRGR